MILKFYTGMFGKRKKRLTVVAMDTSGNVYVEKGTNYRSREEAGVKVGVYKRQLQLGQLNETNLRDFFKREVV